MVHTTGSATPAPRGQHGGMDTSRDAVARRYSEHLTDRDLLALTDDRPGPGRRAAPPPGAGARPPRPARRRRRRAHRHERRGRAVPVRLALPGVRGRRAPCGRVAGGAHLGAGPHGAALAYPDPRRPGDRRLRHRARAPAVPRRAPRLLRPARLRGRVAPRRSAAGTGAAGTSSTCRAWRSCSPTSPPSRGPGCGGGSGTAHSSSPASTRSTPSGPTAVSGRCAWSARPGSGCAARVRSASSSRTSPGGPTGRRGRGARGRRRVAGLGASPAHAHRRPLPAPRRRRGAVLSPPGVPAVAHP